MNKKIVNTSATRIANQRLILDILRRKGAMSAADISKQLGVPAGTVARVTSALNDMKLIRTVKSRRVKRVGKPPVMLKVNDRLATLIGIELNELAIRIIMTNFSGRVLVQKTVRTDRDTTKVIPDQICKLIHEVIAEIGTENGPLEGIGIGISGLIDPDSRIVSHGFLPQGLDIPRLLENEFRVPVMVGNDANLAVQAEAHFGDGKNYENILCLFDRGWVGAGLIINGSLYQGLNYAAGELTAGMHRNGDAKQPGGLLEFPFIESYGMERMIRRIGFEAYNDDDFTSRDELVAFIYQLAKDGDPKANAIIDHEIDSFATAIFRLVNFIDPGLVIVHGDITQTGNDVESRIFEKVVAMRKSEGRILKMPDMAFSRIGDRAVPLGAISILSDELVERLICQE